MKDLVIIGAGGFGRTVYWQCDADYGNGRDWTIKGFLDDRPNILDGFGVPKPILGSPFTYKPQPNEIWLCALGEPQMRRKYAAPLVAQGRRVHQSAHRSRVSCVGEARPGHHLRTQGPGRQRHDDRRLRHDPVDVGDRPRRDRSATTCRSRASRSSARAPRSATMCRSTRTACILPGVSVGDRAVIGAGSVVVKNVPADSTVFGNPAKVVFTR